MPKRKYKDDDDEIEYLSWKIKKLRKKLRRNKSKNSDRSRRRSRSRHATTPENNDATVEELCRSHSSCSSHHTDAAEELAPTDSARDPSPHKECEIDLTTSFTETIVAEPSAEDTNTVTAIDEVGNELLDILGVDPSSTKEYSKDIHSELASRLQHIATTGLTKEARKELNTKYLIPANCTKLGAPEMNLEIKAALTETVVKRDKGIEARQKQLASAISGVAILLNNELDSKDKDPTRSKQLMDVCRILCDIQHSESITRRNFAIFSIKRELKEHLVNTKIDKNLFGENLADTLKSAKAVTKSGSELKTKPPPKAPKTSTPIAGNLNWRSPAPARRQQNAGRGRGAVPPPPVPGPMTRSYRSTTHAGSSKPSQYPPRKTRRY